MLLVPYSLGFFFFNDTATTEIYTLSLHDALPICYRAGGGAGLDRNDPARGPARLSPGGNDIGRGAGHRTPRRRPRGEKGPHRARHRAGGRELYRGRRNPRGAPKPSVPAHPHAESEAEAPAIGINASRR